MTYVDRVAAPFTALVTEAVEDERDLIRRAQERDAGAFERLYRGHVRRVYAVCLRMTANVTQAEDLTQKTFITLWEKIRLFRGESAFSSWLHRVAVNTVLTEIRADHRRTQRVFATEDPADFETAARGPAPGTHMDLEAAIATLPPQARIVFVLHDVEGWQHHEIAEHLGVATGTSKAQLHRARKLLQEALR
jgi:RNA polymerase sigma-70 factor, ECF subfamily